METRKAVLGREEEVKGEMNCISAFHAPLTPSNPPEDGPPRSRHFFLSNSPFLGLSGSTVVDHLRLTSVHLSRGSLNAVRLWHFRDV